MKWNIPHFSSEGITLQLLVAADMMPRIAPIPSRFIAEVVRNVDVLEEAIDFIIRALVKQILFFFGKSVVCVY